MSAHSGLMGDLFSTALEGGVNYWSHCTRYEWKFTAPDDYDLAPGYVAVIHDDETERPPLTVDKSVVARGYKLATTTHRDSIGWSVSPPPLVVTDESRDAWDFDAGDADAIVQLGLFGQVVYG